MQPYEYSSEDLSDRSEKAKLNFLIELIMFEMNEIYDRHSPKKGNAPFVEEFYVPMGKDPKVFEESFIRERMESAFNNAYDRFDIVFLELACAYHIHAITRISKLQYADAWLFLADSRYWCAMAKFNANIASIKEENAEETKKSQARTGGIARGEIFKLIKNEAIRLYIHLEPQPDGWKTKGKAVDAIRSDVVEFSNRNGGKLTSSNSKRKIGEWLTKIHKQRIAARKDRD